MSEEDFCESVACFHRSHTAEQDISTDDRMEEDKCSHGDEEDKKPPESHPTAAPGTGRTWWVTDDLGHQLDHQPVSGCSRWNFSAITFPDVGSTESSTESSSSSLLPPDPCLLPGSLAVGVCNVAPWRQRINLREVKMSSKEQRTEEDKQRHRWDINKDREVCRTQKCSRML